MIEKTKGFKKVKTDDKALKANVERLRLLIKDSFYPLLKEKSKNIEEASIFCQVIAGYINSGFSALSKTYKLKDLKLEDFIDKNYEDREDLKKVLVMLENETLADALMVTDGMAKAIGACVNKELKNRKLEELTELTADFA